MLIAVDIGNTNITIGVFKFYSRYPVAGPVNIWRLSTNEEETVDDYSFKILNVLTLSSVEMTAVRDIAIASVVPRIDPIIEKSVQNLFNRKPFFVTCENIPIIKIRYLNPQEVGADRLAGAVAGYALRGGPLIIIDFGTATTFDCINSSGDYLGGAIVPGLTLAARSLKEHTARLPRVDITKPEKAIGTSTIESIQSGIYFGYLGLVKEMIARLKKELGREPLIIGTGGLAEVIAKDLSEIKEIIPELTLEGIRIIWEKNH